MGQPTDGAHRFPAGRHRPAPAGDRLPQLILLPIFTGIACSCWVCCCGCVIRYNRRANPTPARFTHNTAVEVLWTAVPVLILLFIAIFSFRLLFDYHDMPAPDLTVKANGYQWYWGYAYPDQKIAE